ncbi:metallophosphoesterase [Luteococcus sp. Sow4_B9]|uniref:metallophosphoesterase n=1 Tax=Luteococcus sp. Sow4_B9 TaxID=3438792 RepID=UPI003F992C30
MSQTSPPEEARPGTARRLLRWAGRLALVALVLLALVAGMSWYEVTHTRLEQLTVTSSKVSGRPLRVLQISDLHDVTMPQRDELVEMARAQKPDLIAVTGDLVNMYTKDLERISQWFGHLVALGIPVYAVPGNHDHWDGHIGPVLDMLASHDIPVLTNRHVAFDGDWGRVDLVGTDDYYSGLGDLPSAMRGTRPDAFQLVLTHSPQVFDDLAASDAELAICGHTHGGQVRIPWVGAIHTPGGDGWFPRLDKGLFPAGQAMLYIDSGVGQTLPLRLFTPSQMTLVTITPAA